MTYIDSHAHLTDAAFDADREAVLGRARAAGVRHILTIANGAVADEFERAARWAEAQPGLWLALGVHPHDARHADSALLERSKRLARGSHVLAWGEVGLDYHYDHSPRPVQQALFREQLYLAGELEVPVIIHCREAWSDCLEILSTCWAATGRGGILHCFSGTLEDARAALAWNFLISFAGNLTFPRAENLRATAAALPLDRLLIETDCPYLAPQAHRGQRNEPAYVPEVAAALERLKGLSAKEVGRATSDNFLRLFPRAQQSGTE